MGSEPARIAVTGASGFVGLNVLDHVLARGIDAVALDTAPLPEPARVEFSSRPGGLTQYVADITDPSAVADALDGAAAVIHGAAITAGSDRERSEARTVVAVNVLGTQTVLDAVSRSSSVTRVVYVSSGAVYGNRVFGDEAIDESTPPEPASLYGATKWAGELLVRRHAALHGTAIAIARLSALFGPWERDTGVRDSLSPMYVLAQARHRGAHVVAAPYAPRNWLYARDAAAALAELAVGPPSTHVTYNVAPSASFEPMAWADHLGIAGPGDGPSVTLEEEPGQSLSRAAVATDRLRNELADWPRFDQARAFLDYEAWLNEHDGYE